MIRILTEIQWTTVVASAISAAVIGTVQLIANRYVTRMLDRIEKGLEREIAKGNGPGKSRQ